MSLLIFWNQSAGGSQDTTADLTGQALSFSAGTLTATGAASAAVTGQAVSYGTGSLSLTGSASVAADGQVLTWTLGDETASGTSPDVTVDLTGLELALALGTLDATGDGVVAASGQTWPWTVGTLDITTTETVTVGVTGLVLNWQLGDESIVQEAYASDDPCWGCGWRGGRGRR